MSLENLENFLDRYRKEKEFRDAINNAPNIDAKKRIAKEAGFEFTKEEVKAFFEQGILLSDNDLTQIVGGTNVNYYEEFKAAMESSF